jgi:hypothetical protein
MKAAISSVMNDHPVPGDVFSIHHYVHEFVEKNVVSSNPAYGEVSSMANISCIFKTGKFNNI